MLIPTRSLPLPVLTFEANGSTIEQRWNAAGGTIDALRVWRVDWNRLDDQPRSGVCRALAPRHRAGAARDSRGVRGGHDPGAGLGDDDPGGILRLAAVQWSTAGRWFCGLTDPVGTQRLKSMQVKGEYDGTS